MHLISFSLLISDSNPSLANGRDQYLIRFSNDSARSCCLSVILSGFTLGYLICLLCLEVFSAIKEREEVKVKEKEFRNVLSELSVNNLV